MLNITFGYCHTHIPWTNAWMLRLINLLERESNHIIIESCIISDQWSSFQHLEGASGFFTMLIQIAIQRGNQTWTLNEYPSEFYQVNQPRPPKISSETVGTTIICLEYKGPCCGFTDTDYRNVMDFGKLKVQSDHISKSIYLMLWKKS